MSMPEWIWLNGETIPFADARVSVEDRGFQFADGVYEVIRVYGGKPFTLIEHLARLENSARGIELNLPIAPTSLADEITRFVSRTQTGDGMVYLQLTRGPAPRNHIFPEPSLSTLLFYVRELPPSPLPGMGDGMKLMSLPDERWKRCWIKSIALLPNVLAKNAAVRAGFDEAVFIDDGRVTECAASNVFAVIAGTLLTPPVGSKVLPGITRALLLESARRLEIQVEERPWSEAEAIGADELFITSTTREISWVSQWNHHNIGQGKCGPVTQLLHEALQARVAADTR